MLQSRRSFLRGLGATLIAAPAVVRAASLMPIRGIVQPISLEGVPLTFDGGFPMLTEITRKAFVPRLFVQLWMPDKIPGLWLEPRHD